ncbi:MAG TPA: peptide deformylase [Candidatus Dormibacteraeota bacterium]|jgi:peptide deformylase|nr:peptide deformylase [Candidatus Dormibacteraeota bacterium]
MIRRVVTFPDPVLKRRCEPVPLARALALAEDLVDTMRAHPGCVGLAAPQVGEPVRVAVVDVAGHRLATAAGGLLVLIDPEITGREGGAVAREGCLSLPDITADVARAERITLLPRPGGPALWAQGFEARALQHEIDHLDGVLILDRVTSVHALHPRRVRLE